MRTGGRGWKPSPNGSGRTPRTERRASITCSALKKRYRDVLRGEGVVFVFLQGSKDKISDRLASRHGHFMPPALLESQFDALEAPTADENHISLCVSARRRKRPRKSSTGSIWKRQTPLRREYPHYALRNIL